MRKIVRAEAAVASLTLCKKTKKTKKNLCRWGDISVLPPRCSSSNLPITSTWIESLRNAGILYICAYRFFFLNSPHMQNRCFHTREGRKIINLTRGGGESQGARLWNISFFFFFLSFFYCLFPKKKMLFSLIYCLHFRSRVPAPASFDISGSERATRVASPLQLSSRRRRHAGARDLHAWRWRHRASEVQKALLFI